MDLKEINEKLYPHNVRFLINSKPYYFNILNIPFDQEITTIELQYNERTVIRISMSWDNKLILNHMNINKVGFTRHDKDKDGNDCIRIIVPAEFFKTYLTLQHFLNILSSPALPNLLKELYNIHTEMDEKVYNSNWSTEVLLNQP